MKRLILFVFLILMVSFPMISALETTLFFEKKVFGGENYIHIYLSDKYGSDDPEDIDMKNQDYIFFTYEPEGDWELSEKDMKDKLNEIVLIQHNDVLEKDYLNPVIIDEKLLKVVAAFKLRDLDFSLPVKFKLDESLSSQIFINEELWPVYDKFYQLWQDGRNLFDRQEYLQAFEMVLPFDQETDPLIRHLSFYREAILLVKSALKAYTESSRSSYELINFDLLQELNTSNLDRLINLEDQLIAAEKSFKPYFTGIEGTEEGKIITDFTDLRTTVSFAAARFRSDLEREKLQFLVLSNYFEYKFRLYIDLICSIMIRKETIEIIDSADTLDIDHLALFPDRKEDLEILEWDEEFRLLLKLINENLRNENYYFGEEIIKNLNSQIDIEPQPYARIFSAFDHLCRREFDKFAMEINEAFIKCSDPDMIMDLENWYLSYLCTVRSVDEAILDTFQTGIDLEESEEIDQARKQYEIAVKLYHNFAPPLFYLGRLYHQAGEPYKAEIYFEKALEIQPEYMAPRIYKIEFLMDRSEYNQALTELNAILREMPYWIFYFLKARSLYELDKYDEALQVLVEYCLKLNEFEVEEYFLLGDVYLAMGHRNKAIESYMEAGKLDPENKKYVEKMNKIPGAE